LEKYYLKKTAKEINLSNSKEQKMKKLFSNGTEKALEVANQVIYSFKVLMIGLFIPFVFIFGISYNRHTATEESEINMSKQNVATNNNTVAFVKVLPDQNA